MVVSQGDIWWAELGAPVGSAPGHRRPLLIVQCDRFNESRLNTVVGVPLTGNLRLARSPGNVLLSASQTGLPGDSVANVTQIATVDRSQLLDWAGRLERRHVQKVFAGIDVVLGR